MSVGASWQGRSRDVLGGHANQGRVRESHARESFEPVSRGKRPAAGASGPTLVRLGYCVVGPVKAWQ